MSAARTDRRTDGFSPLYSRLAKVPALSCRLGRVPYDRTFGALTCDCAPYDCTYGALIVRSLSITKKFDFKKNWFPLESNLYPPIDEPDAQPTQYTGHSSLSVRNVVYIINCVWAAVLQECW